ncbi:MAG: pilus assembly protein [Proteobacteria bacterium]|nr:pilus assembly protein [Pseudomonadota bacterium]
MASRAGVCWYRNSEGGICVEFAIVLVPLLLFVMGIAQLCLLYAAKLVVQHAATTAARAAIVVLDDEPKHYGGTPRGTLEASATSRYEPRGGTPGGTKSLTSLLSTGVATGGGRRSAIQHAAHLPLLSVAPDYRRILTDRHRNVRAAIGDHGATRLVGGMLYTRAAAAVTFPNGPAASDFHGLSYGPSEEITVRVTFLFPCVVPLASAFVCTEGRRLLADSARSASGLGSSNTGTGRQRNAGSGRSSEPDPALAWQSMKELKRVSSPALLTPLLISGRRFAILRAEATLPNQGASYAR